MLAWEDSFPRASFGDGHQSSCGTNSSRMRPSKCLHACILLSGRVDYRKVWGVAFVLKGDGIKA
jgi:hypothetical protein